MAKGKSLIEEYEKSLRLIVTELRTRGSKEALDLAIRIEQSLHDVPSHAREFGGTHGDGSAFHFGDHDFHATPGVLATMEATRLVVELARATQSALEADAGLADLAPLIDAWVEKRT